MSGKVKTRASANTLDSTTGNINERILKECHTLYRPSDPENPNGLCKIADNLGLTLLAPRKKITVLLIGNHSAGKSSFINWYIEEHVQRTGVAIETQGFSFIASGRKRESLTGNATLHLYPHFEPLRKLEGVVDYLTTEVSTSKQKKFSLITFVDSPGLVDGDMKYPFDVNEAILWLGDLADLMFVFFDPIGQALCKRTLNLVEKLNEKHADRMRFYLSKADEAGHESDRQRVMMQIVQELCKRPGLNRTGFDMPTIYIPGPNTKSRCANQIEEVCKDIEKTINQTIQTTLNTLENDCMKIADLIDKKIQDDAEARSSNLRGRCRGCFCTLLGFMLPTVLFLYFLLVSTSKAVIQSVIGKQGQEMAELYLSPVKSIFHTVPKDYHVYILGGVSFLSLLLLIIAKFVMRSKPTLTRAQKRLLLAERDYVQNNVRKRKEALYQEYLQQSVAEHDL